MYMQKHLQIRLESILKLKYLFKDKIKNVLNIRRFDLRIKIK